MEGIRQTKLPDAGVPVYTATNHVLEPLLTSTSPLGAKPFDKEWKFLCACASPLHLSAGALASLMLNLDWDLLLELAEGHRVLGVMAARLKETAFAGVPV